MERRPPCLAQVAGVPSLGTDDQIIEAVVVDIACGADRGAKGLALLTAREDRVG